MNVSADLAPLCPTVPEVRAAFADEVTALGGAVRACAAPAVVAAGVEETRTATTVAADAVLTLLPMVARLGDAGGGRSRPRSSAASTAPPIRTARRSGG